MTRDPVMARLRRETEAFHLRLESHPFFEALTAHRLPLESYVRQLRALAVIHSVFEREAPRCDHPKVNAVWRDDLRKLDLLLLDLDSLGGVTVLDSLPATDAALALAEQIRLRALANPVGLLGHLYVLEGATLGNNQHRPDILASFELQEPAGSRYYGAYGGDVARRWKDFGKAMNAALTDAATQDQAAEAAVEAFSGLEVLYTALYPADQQPKLFHVTQINPEAGSHPITQDEAEIAAARRASERAWNDFGYFEARYGRRGKRFSDSDACWLVTLKDLAPDVAESQLRWLSGVLAPRGMPPITLERTLDYLYQDLSVTGPAGDRAYTRLAELAERLRAARNAAIPEASFEALARRFDERVGPDLACAYKGTGQLLLSAVAEERNGGEGVVEASLEWLTDPGRFSAAWISAVHEALAEARGLVG